jgi:hypothetical protein
MTVSRRSRPGKQSHRAVEQLRRSLVTFGVGSAAVFMPLAAQASVQHRDSGWCGPPPARPPLNMRSPGSPAFSPCGGSNNASEERQS